VAGSRYRFGVDRFNELFFRLSKYKKEMGGWPKFSYKEPDGYKLGDMSLKLVYCVIRTTRNVKGMLREDEYQKLEDIDFVSYANQMNPRLYKSPRAHVSGLTDNIQASDLRALFEEYGEVSRVIIPLTEKKTRKNYAFVKMLEESELENAINGLNGKSFKETVLKVEMAEHPRPIYVSGLTDEIKVEEIRELFEAYGRVGKIERPVFSRKNPSKGDPSNSLANFCFLKMYKEEDLKKAIEALNGAALKNAKLTVKLAKRKSEPEKK
jgi:RNA recognition motif-containing protein